jgi:hypothetical protein
MQKEEDGRRTKNAERRGWKKDYECRNKRKGEGLGMQKEEDGRRTKNAERRGWKKDLNAEIRGREKD